VQLKVNIRLLWSPAAEALASLAHHFGDIVWGLMFWELQAMHSGGVDHGIPSWLDSEGGEEWVNDDEVVEEERTWRDSSAHKLCVAVEQWSRDDHKWREIIRVSSMCMNYPSQSDTSIYSSPQVK
jgi:U3 small nucleolar RNA-associated protein 20